MQLNLERLDALAKWLEAGAPHDKLVFDMNVGIVYRVPLDVDEVAPNACKTSCCIAGAAVQFFGEQQDDGKPPLWNTASWDIDETSGCELFQVPWYDVKQEASSLLFGPEPDDEEEYAKYKRLTRALFNPDTVYDFVRLPDFSDSKWAARTVRRLMETGEVDWRATAEPGNALYDY